MPLTPREQKMLTLLDEQQEAAGRWKKALNTAAVKHPATAQIVMEITNMQEDYPLWLEDSNLREREE